jgi:membrane associated rhomboid family serine protease
MFPLRDSIGTNRFPIVTLALIVACTLVFLFEISRPASTLPDYYSGVPHHVSGFDRFTAEWGFIPCELLGRCAHPGRQELPTADGDHDGVYVRVPQHAGVIGLFAAIFMHGGWLHIVGNMLFLWIFGNNVEDRMGRVRYLLFYLVCGLLAGLAQLVTSTHSGVPNIGASGAIAGVLGAYLVLYPRARVLTALTLLVFFAVVELPAVLLLGAWFVLQLLDGSAGLVQSGSDGSGTAYFAHVGGFAAGLLLVWPLVRGRPRRVAPPVT